MMKSHFKKLRHLDLFSGIGGFSLGLEATGGFETVAFCDIEEYPRKVLEKHWPHVKQYTDIKELTYDKLKSDGLVSNTEKIDIITGGYPCQPFSVAGRKKGEKDPRHLWPEYFRLVQELRPTWVIGENVSGHIKLGLDTVLKNLESEGYSARTFSISASSVGANHQRERVWIIANSKCNGLTTSEKRGGFEKTISNQSKGKNDTLNVERTSSVSETSSDVANTKNIGSILSSHEEERQRNSTRCSEGQFERDGSTMANTNSERGCSRETRREDAENVGQSSRSEEASGWWDIEPNVGRVAHGVSARVHRLKSLGNSLVPQIPYYIGLSILQSIDVANTNSRNGRGGRTVP